MLYQKNYFSALTGNLSTRSERAARACSASAIRSCGSSCMIS